MRNSLDRANAEMKVFLRTLPSQVLQGYQTGSKVRLPAAFLKVRQILFCGIGGSAIGMDILAQAMKDSCPLPFTVHRGPGLPKWAGRETLVVLTSYSGDTLETLDVLREARGRGARILAVTSGGRLLSEAQRMKFPAVIVPSGMPPRTAVGYLTFALAGVLSRTGWVSCKLAEIKKIQKAMVRLIPRAKPLAKQLHGRMIFLYGDSTVFEAVLKRWRAQFAENSKTLASHLGIPEMFHNEVEGWCFPKFLKPRSAAVFFRKKKESREEKKKTDLALRMLSESGAKVVSISPMGNSAFEQMFSLIVLGDWTSYELACLHRVDSVTIPMIKRIKGSFTG